MRRRLVMLVSAAVVGCGALSNTTVPTPQQPSASGATPVLEVPPVETDYAVAGIEDPDAFRAFFATFQRQVASEEREALAKSLFYPVTVHRHDEDDLVLGSSAELLAQYDKVFTTRVRSALLAQREQDLFANWQGVMVGRGQLWFTPIDDEGEHVLLVTINTDAPAADER